MAKLIAEVKQTITPRVDNHLGSGVVNIQGIHHSGTLSPRYSEEKVFNATTLQIPIGSLVLIYNIDGYSVVTGVVS